MLEKDGRRSSRSRRSKQTALASFSNPFTALSVSAARCSPVWLSRGTRHHTTTAVRREKRSSGSASSTDPSIIIPSRRHTQIYMALHLRLREGRVPPELLPGNPSCHLRKKVERRAGVLAVTRRRACRTCRPAEGKTPRVRTCLTFRKFSSPYDPSSLPKPDRLTPPEGSAGAERSRLRQEKAAHTRFLRLSPGEAGGSARTPRRVAEARLAAVHPHDPGLESAHEALAALLVGWVATGRPSEEDEVIELSVAWARRRSRAAQLLLAERGVTARRRRRRAIRGGRCWAAWREGRGCAGGPEMTADPRPKSESFAIATASSSVRKVATASTGPNTSVRQRLWSRVTPVTTVGAMKYPFSRCAGRLPPVSTVAPSSSALATCPRILSYCACDTTGPRRHSRARGSQIFTCSQWCWRRARTRPASVSCSCGRGRGRGREGDELRLRLGERLCGAGGSHCGAAQPCGGPRGGVSGSLARQEPAGGRADLPVGPEAAEHDPLDDLVDVGAVVEHDERGLAPELQRDGHDVLRGGVHDALARGEAAREGDLGEARVGGERPADVRAEARGEGEGAGGNARCGGDVAEELAGERRELAGLEDDAAARREGRGHLAARARGGVGAAGTITEAKGAQPEARAGGGNTPTQRKERAPPLTPLAAAQRRSGAAGRAFHVAMSSG